MNFLGYIAGTLIAPNLAGYLISKGLTNREEKKLIQEIEEMVTAFNRNFDNTEVDSNCFVEFLEQSNVVSSIIDRVFHAYNTSKDDYNSLSKGLAKEAINFVNLKKDKLKYPHVKIPNDFENYFAELFGVLIDYRESLLSLKDKAMVSIIDESISRTESSIKKTIEEKLGDNFSTAKRIDDMYSDKVNNKIVQQFVDELLTVTRVFKEAFDTELFSEHSSIKETQLKAIKNEETSFLYTIPYVINLIDKFNYLEFNKLSKINVEHRIQSLEFLLKKYYHEDSFKIESFVSRKLENIQNLITGYRGTKCAKFYKALNELELESTLSYISIWEGILKNLYEVFQTISSIVIRNTSSNSDEQFQRLTKEKIKSSISRNLTWIIEDNDIAVDCLKYILEKGGYAADTQIASHFSKDVEAIRKALYPLLGNIILYNFNTLESTNVFILSEVREIVKEVINYAN